MKYKYVYAVYVQTKHGLGVQPTKGNNARQARERFRKRFKKQRIYSVARMHSKPICDPI